MSTQKERRYEVPGTDTVLVHVTDGADHAVWIALAPPDGEFEPAFQSESFIVGQSSNGFAGLVALERTIAQLRADLAKEVAGAGD